MGGYSDHCLFHRSSDYQAGEKGKTEKTCEDDAKAWRTSEAWHAGNRAETCAKIETAGREETLRAGKFVLLLKFNGCQMLERYRGIM